MDPRRPCHRPAAVRGLADRRDTAELGNLDLLLNLHLGQNQLSGEIPPELGNLGNLHELLLWGNGLSGGVPPELGNLRNLTQLELQGNRLTGCVLAGLRGKLNEASDLGGLLFCFNRAS